MDENPQRLYRVKEALPLLGVRSTKFYELLTAGTIRARRVGNRTLVPASEIIRFQQSLPEVGGKPPGKAA